MKIPPRTRSLVTRVAALLTLSVAAPSPVLAQQAAKGGAPVRIEFRAVGDDGRLITDLKPDDLTLKVNGKPRPIESLTLFQASAAIAADAPLPPPYVSNVAGARGRVVQVLVDDDSISPGRETDVRDAVRLLASELSPDDRLGVINTQGTVNIAPSNDFTKTRLAVDGLGGKAPSAESDADAHCRTKRLLGTLGTMLSLGGGAPATIVVFSSGITTPAVNSVRVGSSTSGTSDVCPVEPDDFDNVGRLATAAQADLYLFHLIDGRTRHDSTQDAGFESLAGATGAGFVRVAGNTQSAVTKLLKETAAYYVATFEPDAAERNGQISRVELKTARDRIQLHAHAGVQIAKAIAAKAPAPKDMLRTATAYHDLPLRATAYASRMPSGNDVRVVALFEPLDAATPLVSASVGLFDARGTLKAQWTAQKDDLAKRPARADLQAPAGTYRVRIAAVDASGRAGTTDEDVKAELVRADPLTLSALVIGTQQQGGGFAPRLEFTNEPVAIGLVEVYNVPKNANVSVTLDVVSKPGGQALATADTTLGRGSSDDARTAIGGFGVDNLPPGDYLMRAIVSLDGKPVGMSVRTLRKAR